MIEFEEAFMILALAATVLVFYWSHKSFPPDPTNRLLEQLGDYSKKTPTQADDIAYEVAKALWEMMQAQPPSDPAPTDPPQ